VAEPVTVLLRRALALVHEHRPEAYVEMAASLMGLSVSLSISGEERLLLRSFGSGFIEERPDIRADIRLHTDRGTLRALLRARATLNESLRAEAVELSGAAEALSRALVAFEYFVCALLNIEEAEELGRSLEA
jgi:hypothetical protein